ncbi:MAG TPA: hypothetical protein VE266_12470, partial [Steroidobacteraceae bacterium]|nr:hypothetical protein [Steroidobacteraceae bacterium]
ALAGALGVFAAAGAAPWAEGAVAALAVVGSVHGALLLAARAGRTDDVQQSLGWIYSGYAAALCVAAIVVLPIIDRWQDLPALARRIHADTAHERLALLDPDETTIAMLDFRLQTPFTILTPADAGGSGSAAAARGAATPAVETSKQQLVADWFRDEGPAARVLVLLPGHAPGNVTLWLGRFLRRAPADGDGVAAALIASGTAVLVQRYELPQGRRYALLGPPS